MNRVAAVQAAPVWMDAQGTTDKTIALIDEAGSKDLSLIAFGESWIPGYPFPIWLAPPMAGMDLVMRYRANSITIDGPEIIAIGEAAARNNCAVVVGFAERDGGSLYAAQVLIDEHGSLVMHRRKLKPTHVERTIWGEGPADDLKVTPTSIGRVGALNCWENIQPLNKHGLFQQNEQIHVAAWPAFCLFKEAAYALGCDAAHANSQSYAIEGQCYVLAPTSITTPEVVEQCVDGNEMARAMIVAGGGGAAVFGPDGRRLTDPIPEDEDGFAIAEIDLGAIDAAKVFADPAGHYLRPDVARIVLETSAGPAGRKTPAVSDDAPRSPDGDSPTDLA